MKRIISKVLMTLFFFVFIANISSAQNTARGIAAEKIAVEQNNEVKRNEPHLYFSTGHTDGVKSIVYSPNEKYIATGGYDKTIRIWNVETGKEIRKFCGHTSSVRSISYTPDGKYIISGSGDGTIRIWNVEKGKEIKKITENSCVYSISCSPDGKNIVSGSGDKIVIRNLKTGERIKMLEKFDNKYSNECIVSYSPDGKYVAVGYSSKITIYTSSTGIEVKKILKIVKNEDSDFITSLSYSPDGKYITCGSFKGIVTLWDSKNGKELWRFEAHKNTMPAGSNCAIEGLAYSFDGKYIATGSYDCTIKIWNTESKKKVATLKTNASVFCCRFNYIGNYIISGELSGRINIWNFNTKNIIQIFEAYANTVDNVIFNFDDNSFFSRSYLGLVDIWNTEFGTKKNNIEDEYLYGISVGNAGILPIVISGKRREVAIRNANTLDIIKKIKTKDNLNFVAYSSNGKYILCGYYSLIQLWNAETCELLEEWDNPLEIRFFSYSLDEKYIVGAGKDKIIRIWNTKTRKEIMKLEGHSDYIKSIDCSPSAKYIASGSMDETIRIWDVKIGKEIRILKGHLGYVNSVKYSPNGKFIVSCGNDNTIRVWNVETGKEWYRLEGHSSGVNTVSYSHDGKHIISGSDDGTIKVWNAETGSLIYTIVNGKNGDYLTYTPEGFFTGTEWAMKNLVHIVDGMDVIGIDQVYDKLYRPDLVAAKMRGEDISEYAKEVNLASIVRSGNAPAVAIKNLPELSDSRDVTFDICVQNTGGGIGNVSIVLNGKTIRLSEGVESSNGEQKIFRHTVTLQNGQNKIEAFAMNSAGMIESRRASADVNWQGKTSKPNQYVLTVAVNKYRDKDLWLNYCVPDAASIEESFKKQQSGLYQNVCVYSLKDAEVTKEGLEQKFKELSSIVTADDVFVFFVSGHGTTYDDGDYYFIPVNFRYTNKTDIPLNAISKSDLTKNLSLIKAGKTLMMLDTCNSGSFFADSNKRGMGDKGIFERLSRATGHAILAAASDSQSAMEGYNGHGVFTYVLLDGLAGNADSDGDGFVTLTELSSYVENQVPELSYEKWGYEQVPQKELRRQDFPIAEKLSE